VGSQFRGKVRHLDKTTECSAATSVP
jgi:hypothetical protein